MNLHATLMNNEYIDRKKKSYSRMATNVEGMTELESYQLAANHNDSQFRQEASVDAWTSG